MVAPCSFRPLEVWRLFWGPGVNIWIWLRLRIELVCGLKLIQGWFTAWPPHQGPPVCLTSGDTCEAPETKQWCRWWPTLVARARASLGWHGLSWMPGGRPPPVEAQVLWGTANHIDISTVYINWRRASTERAAVCFPLVKARNHLGPFEFQTRKTSRNATFSLPL